jgi:hypothetical protein
MQLGKNLQWEKVSGEPIVIGDTRITPQARVLSVRFPSGGFVWNRPVSMIVERDGARKTIAVPDVTLISQIAIAASLLIFPILFFINWKGAKR